MQTISDKELKELRYLFPVTKRFVYLNHAGVAPISRRVADAVLAFNQEALYEGYSASARWNERIARIRGLAAQLIGAQSGEIAFVKNTSHALSLVARGLTWQEGDEILISETEFPSNVYPWMALPGVTLKKIPALHGELQLKLLPELVTPRTRLISLSSVQFSSGYRLPVAEVGAFCRERKILFCLDAIQSLGAFPLHVKEAGVDFLAADGHKWMLGHEGIGIFYVRDELIPQLDPALIGWNSVEQPWDFDRWHFELRRNAERFEEGSPNGLSIYGLGAATELLLEVGVARIAERILHLTDALGQGLKSLGLQLYHSLKPEHRSGIVVAYFPEDASGQRIRDLERHLFCENIFASLRGGRLRLSPHFYNSEEEIAKVLECTRRFLEK